MYYATFDSWRVPMFRCHVFWPLWNLGLLEISQMRHSKPGTRLLFLVTDGREEVNNNGANIASDTKLPVAELSLTPEGVLILLCITLHCVRN
jgi:hypothetical protein